MNSFSEQKKKFFLTKIDLIECIYILPLRYTVGHFLKTNMRSSISTSKGRLSGHGGRFFLKKPTRCGSLFNRKVTQGSFFKRQPTRTAQDRNCTNDPVLARLVCELWLESYTDGHATYNQAVRAIRDINPRKFGIYVNVNRCPKLYRRVATTRRVYMEKICGQVGAKCYTRTFSYKPAV